MWRTVSFKEPIKDVKAAAKALKNTVGVVDHGLFVDMTYRETLPLTPLTCVLDQTS